MKLLLLVLAMALCSGCKLITYTSFPQIVWVWSNKAKQQRDYDRERKEDKQKEKDRQMHEELQQDAQDIFDEMERERKLYEDTH